MLRIRRLAVLATLLCASCTSFEFQRQQILLRYQPESDVLDMLLVYEDVGANKADQADEDAETLARIAGGRRHFVLMDWPFDFDLEKILEDDLDPEDTLAERFRAFSGGIQVLGAAFARGAEDELCLVQRARIGNISSGLRLLDQLLNRWILAEEAQDPGAWTEEFAGDQPMAELWLSRARGNGSWARFDAGSLAVSLPTTSRQAALSLAGLMEGADEDLIQLSHALSTLQITGEEARLTFVPAADGWIHFSFTFEEREPWPVEEELGEREPPALAPLADEIRRLKALE
jgi:hypothetical protein